MWYYFVYKKWKIFAYKLVLFMATSYNHMKLHLNIDCLRIETVWHESCYLKSCVLHCGI